MHLTSLLNCLSVTVILCSVDWCVEAHAGREAETAERVGDEPEQINKSLSVNPTGQEACATGEAETIESVGDETESVYRKSVGNPVC